MAARTPERFVRELSAAIESSARGSEGRVDLVRRKKRTVMTECGWDRSSSRRLRVLAGLLDASGIGHLPDLAESRVSADTWLRFSKRDLANRPLGKIFGKESGLEHFVNKYFTTVFADHPELTGLTHPRMQAPITIGSTEHRMDMLFDDPNDCKVIVEFKKGDPTLGVVAQLRKYMNALHKKTGSQVRGVIITAKPRTENLEAEIWESIERNMNKHQIDWFWYSVDVYLQAATTNTSQIR